MYEHSTEREIGAAARRIDDTDDNFDVDDPLFVADRELEAAIEYKLAISGLDGVAFILEIVNRAVRRHAASDSA